MTKIAVFG